MAKIQRTREQQLLGQFVDEAKEAISRARADRSQLQTINSTVIGLENFTGEANQMARENWGLMAREQLRVGLSKIPGLENLNDQQLEAASIIMGASADPVAYANAAMADNYGSLANGEFDAPMMTDGMDLGVRALGLEYFNETSLDTHLATSLVFNAQSARQDEFCEGFFRTIVIDASECGMLVEIDKSMIHRGVKHAMHQKDSQPYERRNLLDAATDPTVLEDMSVKFVPYMLEDDTNASYFVPAAIHAPEQVRVGSYFVRTNPLRVTSDEKPLMSLSAHPGLVTSGVLDESDEFDGRFALEYIYLGFRKPSQTEAQTRLVRFPTLNLARASFNKSQEGSGREMSLEFRGSAFMIDEHTVDTSGTAIEALQEVKDGKWKIKIAVDAVGTVDLQKGNETFTPVRVKVIEVIDSANQSRALTDAAVAPMLKSFETELFGYKYAATRSNSNRRSKGMLLDNVAERERYKIQLGSPITSRKPVGRTDNTAALKGLITAARFRNNNQGVTKLLGYTEQLDTVVKQITDDYAIATIEGVGRHYIRPWCKIESVDVQKVTSAFQTSDQPDQLRAAMLQRLRNQVAQAYRESRMQPALEMLSGYTISKPEVLIGTDVETAQWLWQTGDVRTLGDQFKYRVVTTNDKRFYGRIQWVFTVGTEGYSPLNFGNMLWVPELVTDTNLTRNDGVANEITVQPRTYHVVNCPITGVINIIGLREFIDGKPNVGIQGLKAADDLLPDNQLDPLPTDPAVGP